MKVVWQTLKTHPFALMFYAFYLWVFASSCMREIEYERIIKQNNGHWPYGVREWAGMLLMLTAIIFFLISGIFAIFVKQKLFYILLMAFIIIPIIIYHYI